MTVLHRTEDRRPIAQIPAETWIWDDRNDEPALFNGWSTWNSCYTATWLEHGTFCLFDREGDGQPTVLEVLRVSEEEEAGA